MDKEKQKRILAMVMAGLIIGIAVFFYIQSRESDEIEEIKYTEFEKMAESGEIKEMEINFNDPTFTFKNSSGEEFKTDNPRSFNFKKFLLDNEIDVEEVGKKSVIVDMLMSLFMTLISVVVMVFLLRSVLNQSIASPNLNHKTENVVTRFSDIAGNEESKQDMMFLVKFLKEPKKYIDMGAKLPKGVILFGAPGTGKTLTARAIAGEAGVPFFNVSGSDFIEMYAGLGAKRVRTLFKEAKESAPCIVFIDEIDALGTNRGEQSHSEKDQTINALLAEMDGFNTTDGVIVMAATNRMEDLDKALIRPGRFDRHIAVELPEYRDRLNILKLHSSNKNMGDDVDLDALSKMTIGFSGAALEALINEATINAVNRGSKVVENEDIEEAHFKMLIKGNKKKDSDRTKKETELVAYHEGGHALMAKLITDNDIPKVTIIPSTSGVGGVTFNVPRRISLLSRQDLENEIMVLYSGRAAEEVLKGNRDEITTGASNDIERATELIKGYFNNYGMSEKYGMIKISSIKEGEYLEEAIEMSKRLYSKTLNLLEENRGKLDQIAGELLEKETIVEDDLDRIIFGEELEEV